MASRGRQAVDAGFSHIKLKVDRDLADDIRRLRIAREVLGPDRHPMIDANLGAPGEIAALAVYLASGEPAFTTGTVHVIDGGRCN